MSLHRDAGPVNIYFFAILMSCEIAGADAHVGIVNAVVQRMKSEHPPDARQRPTSWSLLSDPSPRPIVIFSRHPTLASIG